MIPAVQVMNNNSIIANQTAIIFPNRTIVYGDFLSGYSMRPKCST